MNGHRPLVCVNFVQFVGQPNGPRKYTANLSAHFGFYFFSGLLFL